VNLALLVILNDFYGSAGM